MPTLVSSTGETRLERRGQRWMFVKGRLRDGVTMVQAAGPVRLGAAGLMLVVGLVLPVACANVMGMLLAGAPSHETQPDAGASRGLNRAAG